LNQTNVIEKSLANTHQFQRSTVKISIERKFLGARIQTAFQKHLPHSNERSVYKLCSNCHTQRAAIAIALPNGQSITRLREIVGTLVFARYRYSSRFSKTVVFSAIAHQLN
jgi:hypothetical protein